MTTTDIRNMAVALALGASVAALSDIAVQGVIVRRSSPGLGGGGLLLVAAMERLIWVGAAALAWLGASPISRWLTPNRPDEEVSSLRSEAFKVVGRLMVGVPLLLLVAMWVAWAFKITLVGSWATEGQVFVAGYYCANVLLSTGPWLLGGAVVLLAGRLMARRTVAA